MSGEGIAKLERRDAGKKKRKKMTMTMMRKTKMSREQSVEC